MSVTFGQSGSSITGTMLMTNSHCFTSGTISTGSTLSGSALVLHVTFGGGLQIDIGDGQTNGRGQIIGHYAVQGGSCLDGNAGAITLTQN